MRRIAFWCGASEHFHSRISLSRGVSSYFRAESRSGVKRLRIFMLKCAIAWSVLARPPQQKNNLPVLCISTQIGLWRETSSYFRAESRCGAERKKGPLSGISMQIGLWHGTSSYFHAEPRSGVERPHIFTLELRSRGASSYFRAESRSGMKRPRIFTQNCGLAWSVLATPGASENGPPVGEFPRKTGCGVGFSHFHAELRSGVEHGRIFAQNCGLVWGFWSR